MRVHLDNLDIICSNHTGFNNYFAWPTVARLQDGRLAMTASGFRLEHVDPFGKAIICFSEDEGQSWSLPAPVIDTPLDDRDSGVTAFGDNNVIVTSFNNTIAFQHACAARTPETENYKRGYLQALSAMGDVEEKYLGSTFVISKDGGKSFGAVQRIPVTAPHGPCPMPDGTALYVGTKFSLRAEAPEEGQNNLACYRVFPDGSYEFLSEIENTYHDHLFCEPHAVVLRSGKVIVHIRVQNVEKNFYTTFQCESYDMGRSFTKPHQILPNLAGAPCHLIETSDGTIVSVYQYNGEYAFKHQTPEGIPQRNEIRVMFSRDGGETWDYNHVLYGQEGIIDLDMGYPASVELKDGSILTVFYGMPESGSPAVIMQRKWRFEHEV